MKKITQKMSFKILDVNIIYVIHVLKNAQIVEKLLENV